MRFLAAALLLPAILLVANCGKRRPPLPPIERVQQRTELLSGVQQGNQVILSWPAPRRNAPDESVQSIRRIDVYRLAEKPRAPLGLTEEEFDARSTLIGSVTYDEIKNAADTLSYIDTLELAGEPARLRYAVRYVNASGQRAAFSNFLLIEPAARIAQPPTVIATGKEVSEDAITITWQPPAANIDGSTPVNLLGYNVYRMAESEAVDAQTPINGSLVSGTQYQDKNFKFGDSIGYVVRAVSLGTEGGQVESLNSNSIAVSPQRHFPALGADDPLQSPPRRAGCRCSSRLIRKRTSPATTSIARPIQNLPKDKWNKLNAALLTRTTFQDEKVESGRAITTT